MPSNKNPNTLKVGSGRAPQGTVNASSLAQNTLAGISGLVLGSQVVIETPLPLAGDTVQEHVDVVADLAPEVPNLLGSNTKPLNPSNFGPNPALVNGFFGDPATAAQITNSATLVLEGLIFPADRGVLVAEVDSGGGFIPLCGLNLEAIFTEGLPTATVAPARVIGQLDYIAGSNPAGSLGVLPQNIGLVDRLPRLSDYTRANFPFLAGGVDPVYDAYAEDFGGQQLARVTMNVPLPGPGDQGILRVVHYKDETEYQKSLQALPFVSFSLVTITNDLFYDDSLVPLAIGGYSIAANNTVDTSEVGVARRTYSGISHYSENDTFNFTMSGTGLYDDSFLNEGVALRPSAGIIDRLAALNYTAYSPSGTDPGDPSSFSDVGYTNNTLGVVQAIPQLALTDPQGNVTIQNHAGNTFLWAATPNFTTSSVTLETFENEITRYDAAQGVDPTNILLPDGTGTLFSNVADIGPLPELQVRAVAPGRTLLTPTGAELAYPDTDYSSGFEPTTRDGALPQFNYSTATGARYYARAFDVGAAKIRGKLRIAGTLTGGASNFFEVLQNFATTGVRIEIAPAGVPQAIYRDVSKSVNSHKGAMLEMVLEDTNTVLITYQLNAYPMKQSTFFPVVVLVTMDGVGTASTGGNFGIQKLEFVPL